MALSLKDYLSNLVHLETHPLYNSDEIPCQRCITFPNKYGRPVPPSITNIALNAITNRHDRCLQRSLAWAQKDSLPWDGHAIALSAAKLWDLSALKVVMGTSGVLKDSSLVEKVTHSLCDMQDEPPEVVLEQLAACTSCLRFLSEQGVTMYSDRALADVAEACCVPILCIMHNSPSFGEKWPGIKYCWRDDPQRGAAFLSYVLLWDDCEAMVEYALQHGCPFDPSKDLEWFKDEEQKALSLAMYYKVVTRTAADKAAETALEAAAEVVASVAVESILAGSVASRATRLARAAIAIVAARAAIKTMSADVAAGVAKAAAELAESAWKAAYIRRHTL